MLCACIIFFCYMDIFLPGTINTIDSAIVVIAVIALPPNWCAAIVGASAPTEVVYARESYKLLTECTRGMFSVIFARCCNLLALSGTL